MLNSRVKLCSLVNGSKSWVWMMWGLEPLWRDGPYGRDGDGVEESVADVERGERVEREKGLRGEMKKRWGEMKERD